MNAIIIGLPAIFITILYSIIVGDKMINILYMEFHILLLVLIILILMLQSSIYLNLDKIYVYKEKKIYC